VKYSLSPSQRNISINVLRVTLWCTDSLFQKAGQSSFYPVWFMSEWKAVRVFARDKKVRWNWFEQIHPNVYPFQYPLYTSLDKHITISKVSSWPKTSWEKSLLCFVYTTYSQKPFAYSPSFHNSHVRIEEKEEVFIYFYEDKYYKYFLNANITIQRETSFSHDPIPHEYASCRDRLFFLPMTNQYQTPFHLFFRQKICQKYAPWFFSESVLPYW